MNILGCSRTRLAGLLAEFGAKPYRASQVLQWIYHHRVSNFDEMTNLSKQLRLQLSENLEIKSAKTLFQSTSRDGTTKWLVESENGDAVETVLIPDGSRNTLCISSQLGCALDCSFCSTGKQGFNGNLSTAEIVTQVYNAVIYLERDPSSGPLTNIVFMGMGEPLLNCENVLASCELFTDDMAFGISKRRVTISTAGVVPRILDMCGRTEVSLAVSLHAPNDDLRAELVPLNRRYPLKELMAACKAYLTTLGPRRIITFEYTLMDGVNDSLKEAQELRRLLGDLRCKINLIPFNPFPSSKYHRPSLERIRAFQEHLLSAGIMTTCRKTRGDDINAACGQLTGRVTDRTKRTSQYQRINSHEFYKESKQTQFSTVTSSLL